MDLIVKYSIATTAFNSIAILSCFFLLYVVQKRQTKRQLFLTVSIIAILLILVNSQDILSCFTSNPLLLYICRAVLPLCIIPVSLVIALLQLRILQCFSSLGKSSWITEKRVSRAKIPMVVIWAITNICGMIFPFLPTTLAFYEMFGKV